MSTAVPLVLFVSGLVLFVVGDALWLLRNTFNRPMNVRLTGALILAGVVLLTAGLGAWAVGAGAR
ncbi:MAG: hypothetical protein WD058_01245 [Dehalococcoidia bacterium]